MTREEYVKAKATLEALDSVRHRLYDIADEAREEAREAASQYTERFNDVASEVWDRTYLDFCHRYDKARGNLLRSICEYEIEHPLDIF